jgi:hypothetical protein
MTSQVVVICEDEKMWAFASRFLKKRYGYTTHDIRKEKSPYARGSAEQWVRKQYAIEISALTKRRTKSTQSALVVMTDADNLTVQARIDQLDQALPVTRSLDAPVLMIIPKRNIETWLVYLSGDDVIEGGDNSNYKHHSKASSVTNDQINVLVGLCVDQRFREPVPQSLQMACGQLNKLPRRS